MTAHVDTFARDHLPPRETWPELIFDLPELSMPTRMNVATELLDRAVERGWGDRAAILAPGGLRWTYRELLAQSNRIARVLAEDLGLVPGNRVLLRAPEQSDDRGVLVRRAEGGRHRGGLDAVASREGADRHRHQGRDLARAVRCAPRRGSRRGTARLPDAESVVLFGGTGATDLETLMATKPPTFPDVDTAADDTCVIAFTSGTTGKPKGTMHFHRDLIAACRCWPVHVLRASPDDLFTGSPPLAFTFGLGGLLLFPLSIGAATLLVERPAPDALAAVAAQHRATVLFTAPTSYRAMAAIVAQHDLSSPAKCVSAGEALPASTRKLWKNATGIEIIDGIGATEMFHIFISHDEAHARAGATGTVVPGYRACVMDDAGAPLPAGQVGRLAVKGPTGCRYLADDRQSSYVRGGWNYTGDAYLMDADGYFSYQGRTDDMIISAGYNIGGPEVESALLAHPAVAECGVVASPDAERGQIVKAFVVLRPGFTAGEAMTRDLQDFVKREIAPYKYPRAIEYLESLPRTGTGKLQRAKLRELDEATRHGGA